MLRLQKFWWQRAPVECLSPLVKYACIAAGVKNTEPHTAIDLLHTVACALLQDAASRCTLLAVLWLLEREQPLQLATAFAPAPSMDVVEEQLLPSTCHTRASGCLCLGSRVRAACRRCSVQLRTGFAILCPSTSSHHACMKLFGGVVLADVKNAHLRREYARWIRFSLLPSKGEDTKR